MDVPYKPSTVPLPGGTTSAAGLTMPVVAGTGKEALGQDISGAANLAPYFAHAQSIRDAQAAKVNTLNAHLSTDTKLIGARQDMADLVTNSLDELKQQSGTATSDRWTLAIPNQEQGGDPRTVFKSRVQAVFDTHVTAAKNAYGQDAEALMANQLEKDAHAAYSSFEDGRLKLGIGAAYGNVTTTLGIYQNMARDNPHWAVDQIGQTIETAQKTGLLDPLEAAKLKQTAVDTAWNNHFESRAQQDPSWAVSLQTATTLPTGMQAANVEKYVKLGVGALDAQYKQGDLTQKLSEQIYTEKQAANNRRLMAMVLERKSVAGELPALITAREIDPAKAEGLYKLEAQLGKEPNLANYEKGLAATIETQLMALKYDNKPLQPHWEQDILKSRLKDNLLPDEFTHVMGVLRNVEDYKHQEGQTAQNANVTNANANMKHELRTSGPADKYDSLSEQTIVNADQYFWARMNQTPTPKPWDVAKEAITNFKPIIEKRLGLSKMDKMQLDEARITGMVHTKLITPAAAKEMRDQNQDNEGRRIVQEALKNLPPPPPPGFLDRLRGLLPKAGASTERKPPGVMGGE